MLRAMITAMMLWAGAYGAIAQVSGQGASEAWVQIEARPNLTQAEARARAWSATLENVGGFRLESGWYAIVIGPFSREVAEAERLRLLARGAIPRDSFIAEGSSFATPFWPEGGIAALAPAPDVARGGGPIAVTPLPEPGLAAPLAPAALPDETPAEARASERALSPEARRELQAALQWEGFYFGALDGLIGPGTRNAMADWQAARGFEPTGILTTAQRAAVTRDLRKTRESLGLQLVFDEGAGIAIDLPTALVAFDRYEAPFAHYRATSADEVQVILISQEGDRDRMAALYDVLQTLTVVPVEGSRALNRRSFRIEGADRQRETFAYAELIDGAIKGYILVWPAGDERRRTLAADALRASFQALPGALPDDAGGFGDQRPDLVAGLSIRTPVWAQSGFYVDGDGRVATAAADLTACSRVTLGEDVDMALAAKDAGLGVALLEPRAPLAPIGYARLATTGAPLRSEIAVSGYSFGGVLSAPTLTYGTLEDVRDLTGDDRRARLTLAAEAGDAGGPVLMPDGAVTGLLLAPDKGERALPNDVALTASGAALAAFLSENGVVVEAADPGGMLDPEDLAISAADMTVLVNCWE